MIHQTELSALANARLEDAKILFHSGRFDGAIYLCGYAVEMGLKVRICKTLNWNAFPLTSGEFKNYRSFKTHDLDILLTLSGIEQLIKSEYLTDWTSVNSWNPEARYSPIGQVSKEDAEIMITSANSLLKILKD